MSDIATVTIADEETCFECGIDLTVDGPCEACVARLAKRRVFGDPNIADVLMGRPEVARGWGESCVLCGMATSRVDLGRNVLLRDGTRGFAHETCIWREAPMDLDECKHGLVPASSCVWCSGKQTPIYSRSRSFPARRGGVCFHCGEGFQAGDSIARASSAKGSGWAHSSHLRTLS